MEHEKIFKEEGIVHYPQWDSALAGKSSKQIEYRHRKGISKKYASEFYHGLSKTKEYIRLHRKLYKYNLKQAGKLKAETIQMVYEDNIKQYGTLTCYLCLESIEFGNDALEHKIPLSRSGSNNYNNLAISCSSCNSSKRCKTEIEYKEYKKEKA